MTDNTNKTNKSAQNKISPIGFTLLLLAIFSGGAINVFAQAGYEHTKDKVDQTLRGNGRVNPSTLATEISIPMGTAGDIPVPVFYRRQLFNL